METRVAANAISVFRAERDRAIARLNALEAEAYDYAYHEWLQNGEPFLSELCLTLLVAVRHEVERELLHLAARSTTDGRELTADQYEQRVQYERDELKKRGGWRKLIAKLRLDVLPDWRSMETLRFLANSYKHNPATVPDNDLLGQLGLQLGVQYAPLTESQAVREALSTELGLSRDGDFCDIADELLSRAARFLAAARQAQPQLSRVQLNPISINPDSWPR